MYSSPRESFEHSDKDGEGIRPSNTILLGGRKPHSIRVWLAGKFGAKVPEFLGLPESGARLHCASSRKQKLCLPSVIFT